MGFYRRFNSYTGVWDSILILFKFVRVSTRSFLTFILGCNIVIRKRLLPSDRRRESPVIIQTLLDDFKDTHNFEVDETYST